MFRSQGLWLKGQESQRFVGRRFVGQRSEEPEDRGDQILRLVYVNPFGARIRTLAGHCVGQMDRNHPPTRSDMLVAAATAENKNGQT